VILRRCRQTPDGIDALVPADVPGENCAPNQREAFSVSNESPVPEIVNAILGEFKKLGPRMSESVSWRVLWRHISGGGMAQASEDFWRAAYYGVDIHLWVIEYLDGEGEVLRLTEAGLARARGF
jgi:hypothetical protein